MHGRRVRVVTDEFGRDGLLLPTVPEDLATWMQDGPEDPPPSTRQEL